MKKKILYLTIQVTILLLWESEEWDCESSGQCRVQGRGHVKENCVLARTNMKQFIKVQYMIIHRRRCEIALTIYLKSSLRQISPTNQENGRQGVGLQLLVSPNIREVPHFTVTCISPTLSMPPHSRENQKHNEKNLNSAIFTPLTVELTGKWRKLNETELRNLLTSPASLGWALPVWYVRKEIKKWTDKHKYIWTIFL